MINRTIRVPTAATKAQLRSRWFLVKAEAREHGVTQAAYYARLFAWALDRHRSLVEKHLRSGELPESEAVGKNGPQVGVSFVDAAEATSLLSALDGLVGGVVREDGRTLYQYDVLGAVHHLLEEDRIKPPKYVHTTGAA